MLENSDEVPTPYTPMNIKTATVEQLEALCISTLKTLCKRLPGTDARGGRSLLLANKIFKVREHSAPGADGVRDGDDESDQIEVGD